MSENVLSEKERARIEEEERVRNEVQSKLKKEQEGKHAALGCLLFILIAGVLYFVCSGSNIEDKLPVTDASTVSINTRDQLASFKVKNNAGKTCELLEYQVTWFDEDDKSLGTNKCRTTWLKAGETAKVGCMGLNVGKTAVRIEQKLVNYECNDTSL